MIPSMLEDDYHNDSETAHVSCERYVVFYMGDRCYGLNVKDIQEVQKISDIAYVPGAPPHIVGIMNLRGQVITVADLAKSTGLGHFASSPRARVLIMDYEGERIGFLVDKVDEVVAITAEKIQTSYDRENYESKKPILGVYHDDKERLILLMQADQLL